MSSFQKERTGLLGATMSIALILTNLALAQAQTTVTQTHQPNRVLIEYVQPTNSTFQSLYDLLRDRRALEKVQEILSPLRLPEPVTIKITECGAVNSYYQRDRQTFKPTVTICYELLNHILDSLPNETTPAGIIPADAAVGQFLFTALHEVGHATFEIFNISIFGHEEDAAERTGAAIDWWCCVGLEGVFRGL